MKRITVTNQKGGLGKTCIATNVARVLARDFKKKVLFFDFDLQANSTDTLSGFASELTVYDFLNREFSDEEIERVVAMATKSNLILIKATTLLADSDKFDKNICVPMFLKNLAKLESHFDFMIIDTPPTLGNTLTIAMLISEYILVPLELDSFALMGLDKVLQTFGNIKKFSNSNLKLLGVVINKLVTVRKRQQDLLAEVKSKAGNYLLDNMIHTSGAIQDALSKSCSLRELVKIKGSTDRRAITEFYNLTTELLDRIEEN